MHANSLKLVDVEDFTLLKSYITDTPLNSAAITPVKE
jgi:translation initiation factor 3 subunit I